MTVVDRYMRDVMRRIGAPQFINGFPDPEPPHDSSEGNDLPTEEVPGEALDE